MTAIYEAISCSEDRQRVIGTDMVWLEQTGYGWDK